MTQFQWQISLCLVMATVSTAVAANGDCTKAGTVLSATNPVSMRESPPEEKILFFVAPPGPKVAELKVGDTVTVQGSEIVSAPFRLDVWANVKAQNGASGWIYCGSKSKLSNFAPAK